MPGSIIRHHIENKIFIPVPGVQDMMTAILARQSGFDVLFGSGYWLTGSAYGMPDAGLATYSQMLERMSLLRQSSSAEIIADADTGFGGLLNVCHTVRGYERAGIAAIQFEDQEFPKRCGHMPGKRVVPAKDMAAKVKVAVDTRDSMLVIARSDALAVEGMDAMLARLELYARNGADVLFPEGVSTPEEIHAVSSRFDLPIVVNVANKPDGIRISQSELADAGTTIAIYPSMTSLAALKAMQTALLALKAGMETDLSGESFYDFSAFSSLIGFDEIRSFEEKYAED